MQAVLQCAISCHALLKAAFLSCHVFQKLTLLKKPRDVPVLLVQPAKISYGTPGWWWYIIILTSVHLVIPKCGLVHRIMWSAMTVNALAALQ